MSEKQPESLRLADKLIVSSYTTNAEYCDLNRSAAAELRRQHALLEEMAGAISLADGMPEAMTHPAIKRARAILAKWEASK